MVLKAIIQKSIFKELPYQLADPSDTLSRFQKFLSPMQTTMVVLTELLTLVFNGRKQNLCKVSEIKRPQLFQGKDIFNRLLVQRMLENSQVKHF